VRPVRRPKNRDSKKGNGGPGYWLVMIELISTVYARGEITVATARPYFAAPSVKKPEMVFP
jgi:hypothetical protein